jgi:hypothetical protein
MQRTDERVWEVPTRKPVYRGLQPINGPANALCTNSGGYQAFQKAICRHELSIYFLLKNEAVLPLFRACLLGRLRVGGLEKMGITWEPNDQICNIDGVRWAVKEVINPKTGIRELRSVIIPAATPTKIAKPSSYDESQTVIPPEPIHSDAPAKLSVTEAPLCEVCKQPVPGKRTDRKTCSPKCRKIASRGRQLELVAGR